ncbi:MAG: AraC family transcriptional regulator [Myxococcales bacterium]
MPARAPEKPPQRKLVRHPTSGVECFEAVWRGHRTRHHAHPEYQLTLTMAGSGRFDYHGGQARIPVACFALFHPDEPHVLEAASRSEPWHMRSLHLPTRLVEQAGCPLHQPAPFRAYPELAQAFDAVWNAVQAGAAEATVVARVRALGVALCSLPGLEPRTDARSRIVRRCLAHLDQVLDRNVSISELAELVDSTPAQVRRMLVAATGLPPHALHLQRRIRHGKLLLAKGASVADTAQATGFADQAHFTRHFTSLVGVGPARYAVSLKP